MFTAAELKEAMVIRIEGQVYRVLEAESEDGTLHRASVG
jgi:translation elongation factor P/translation initiation factor 5A